MYIRESIDFNGKELTLETGQIARQAGGAVLVAHGDSHVLVTVVTAEPRKDIGYFPLRVDYEERFYAAGKIPGGFFKREGRPSDAAILTGRMIDRPIRPLFPKGYNDEVQIVATVLSAEPDCPPNALGILGASAALMISDAPFQGPIAGVRIGRKDGQFVVNPDLETQDTCGVEITVAGTKDTVTMIEGMMDELSEDEVVEAIEIAHAAIRQLISLQEQFAARVSTVKKEVPEPEPEDEQLLTQVREIVWGQFSAVHSLPTKQARGEFLGGLREQAVERLVPDHLDEDEAEERTNVVAKAMEALLKEYMRQEVLERGIRLDGRRPEEIRPINCAVGVLPRAHGSSLFTRGETQSLGVVTLGATRSDEQIIDQMMYDGRKRFMLHYNFPPYSVGEVGRIGSPSRRSVGHGYLAENSLKAAMPSEEDFPYVVRIVSEILESNGSSSMATVCSASLAMMDAGVPLKRPVAGIAMGLIEDPVTQQRVILTDIQGAEDHNGDMDFKVVGTREGITGFQLDVKVGGINGETMKSALEQAKRARLAILDEMDRAITEPREELSPYAPKLSTIQIPTDKIGAVIGPGGKMIRQIIEETGAEIDISDDGTVKIAGPNSEAVYAAQEWVKDLTTELETGTVMKVKVTRIVDFGAFVGLKNGSEGLVHVSNLASGYVDNVRDIVSPGDEITIEVIGVDKMGRPDLKKIDGDGDAKPTVRSGEGGEQRQSTPAEKPAPKVDVHAGDIIDGTVTNTTDYGAFVEIAPDVTGLVHISALSDEYVRRVTDIVKPGDPIRVEVLNIDDRGRYKLQRIVPDSEKKPIEDVEVPVEGSDVEGEGERQQPVPAQEEATQPAPAQEEATQPAPAQPETDQPEPAQPKPAESEIVEEPETDEQPTPEEEQPEFEDRW
ncbi:polyribonucleotide nucleotidyltransferase [Candidatus Bipolaricaulota bacterium]